MKGSSVASIKRSRSCSVLKIESGKYRYSVCDAFQNRYMESKGLQRRGKREEREGKGRVKGREKKKVREFLLCDIANPCKRTKNALRYSVLLNLGNYVVSGVTSLSRVNDLVFQFALGDVSSNLLSLIQ